MEGYGIIIFLKLNVVSRIVQHWLIIVINKLWFSYWYAKHSQLLSKSTSVLRTLLQCYKLTSKGACLAWGFLLWMPVDGRTVQENNVPTSWSSCHSLTSMSRVHKNSHYKWDSKWIWHVRWDFLLQIYSWIRVYGVRPILFLERVHINLWNCWLEYKFRAHVIFQIIKHMKDLLHMSLAWQRQMQGHHQYLTGDINTAKLYNP